MAAPVSHGRGGQGNIAPDSTQYVDGEIVRQGVEGEGDGAYSAGRGGAGNIGSPHLKPTGKPHDADVVPELAIRKSQDGDYHIGRGGQGNVEHAGKDKPAEEKSGSLADKLKSKILGKK
jgi:hypothetical protein